MWVTSQEIVSQSACFTGIWVTWQSPQPPPTCPKWHVGHIARNCVPVSMFYWHMGHMAIPSASANMSQVACGSPPSQRVMAAHSVVCYCPPCRATYFLFMACLATLRHPLYCLVITYCATSVHYCLWPATSRHVNPTVSSCRGAASWL
jgi:hypothetical protein